MQLPLPKLKFSIRSTDPLVYLRLAIMTIITFVVAGLCFVLYRDFYQTIVQAETVLVLKQEVAMKDIEIELFQKVQAIHDYKQLPLLPSPAPDPFGTDKIIIAPQPAVPAPENETLSQP